MNNGTYFYLATQVVRQAEKEVNYIEAMNEAQNILDRVKDFYSSTAKFDDESITFAELKLQRDSLLPFCPDLVTLVKSGKEEISFAARISLADLYYRPGGPAYYRAISL